MFCELSFISSPVRCKSIRFPILRVSRSTCLLLCKATCSCISQPEMFIMSEQIYSDMARKTGKSLRLNALFRQNVQTWRENQAPRRAPMKSNFEFNVRLKSAKNLYLSHRFFCKIRQIHRFFNVFRQNLQILCRNQAWSKLGASGK